MIHDLRLSKVPYNIRHDWLLEPFQSNCQSNTLVQIQRKHKPQNVSSPLTHSSHTTHTCLYLYVYVYM